jgi:predicted nucleic-acid-binding Zn-ribbon protein
VKASKKCPKCECADLFYSSSIMDRGEGNASLPLAIGRTGPIHAWVYGQFEVYVCKGCGLSELYVHDPAQLRHPQAEAD